MAIASSNKIRLRTFAVSKSKTERKRAKRVLKFTENYNEVITSIVIFNNIVNVLVTTIATVWASLLFANPIASSIFSFLIMTTLIILIGELLPKMLAKKYTEKGAMFFSRTIHIVNIALTPVTKLLSKMIKQEEDQLFRSEDELREAIGEAEKSGITSKREKDIIDVLLKMDDELIETIMIDKKNSFFISDSTPPNKIRTMIKKSNVTRLPILDKNEKPIGILNANSYLIDYLEDKKVKKEEHTYDIEIYKKDAIIQFVFEDLKNKRQKMGIIVDDQGKFIGLITIEDIIETMFGQMYDEQDFEKNGIYILSNTSILIKPEVNANLIFDSYFPKVKKNSFLNSNKESTFDQFVKKIEVDKKLKIGDYIIYKDIIIWIREDKHKNSKKMFEIDLLNNSLNTKNENDNVEIEDKKD